MTQETPILEQDELERLLASINTRTPTGARNFALLQLMAQTGIRCGEALNVEAADIRQEQWPVNGDKVTVWVLRLPKRSTKGEQERQGIPLTAGTRQALEVWQEKRAALGIRGGKLFCTISRGRRVHGQPGREGFAAGHAETKLHPGRKLNSAYVRQLVARLGERAGIRRRVHPHLLRHTALTALYDKTKSLRLVQDVAGHSTTRMTERYAHVHPVAIAEAMGALQAADASSEAGYGE